MEQYNRCYTRDQCVGHHGHYTFGFDCVPFCPSGYKINSQLDCVRCSPNEPCISVCTPDLQNEAFIVYNLADAHELYGCQILNSSLVFTIRNKVQEKQLAHSLSTIREIRGHLKIYRSSQLTSLQFLKNIQRIHGDPLENKYYALVLYDNKEIRELWTPDAELEFLNGGMYMHRNNKLCNRHMREFQAQVIHDKTLDSLQTNDQEVLCGPAKLLLNVHVRSHRMVQLSWLKSQTSVELELIYRPVAEGQIYPEQSELEAPICTRINWQRRLLFPEQLLDNGTHYNYQLDRLTSDTRYALLLRTFGGEFKREARSDLTFVRTQKDIPEPPQLQLSKKTDNSLTLLLSGSGNSSLDYYELRIYELADDAAYIDERDYCKQPAVLLQDMDGDEWSTPVEDYDDCCSHQQELSDDRRFIEDMRSQYRCSLDEPTNCELWQQPKDSIQLHLSGNTTTHILHDLKRYHLYSLQLRACNELGCSSHTTLNERTNYTLGGDFLPDLSACRVPSTDEYIVRFNDPVQPNGVILSYVLHYRNILSDSGTVMESHVNCLTRRAHAAADFEHVALLNMTFNQCAVRVHSLAGDVLTPFVPINWCDEEQRSTHRPHAHSTTTEQALTNKTNSGVASTVTSPTTTASHARGISFFVVCFLFGCLATMLWVMYKRRCWRKLPGLRHYVPVREQWLRERQQTEDREILVDGFETVRFHNNNNSNNADAY
ncbi:insulin receptor isoform X2 [Scaptodrosophila lebanonensis]|nr:insulin receptor isoform X2 [Scaptodrosophila lebanonensis]